jgi:hypothetical protein
MPVAIVTQLALALRAVNPEYVGLQYVLVVEIDIQWRDLGLPPGIAGLTT